VTKKARLKLLGRVREARKRLRDAAAGELAVAEAEQAVADERQKDAAVEIDEIKDTIADKLAEKRSVRALWTFEHEHWVAKAQLGDLEEEAAAARTESSRHRAILVTRARALKTAEAAMDKTRAGLDSDEQRAEQRLNDDLVGRTPREKP
jgi:hypothetical protein